MRWGASCVGRGAGVGIGIGVPALVGVGSPDSIFLRAFNF